MILGRMWRTMIRRSLAPRARAASTNSRSRAASTWPVPRTQAGITDPSAERERENEIEDAGAAEGDEGDRQQDSWERKKSVHQHDVDEAVDGSSVVSGDRADNESQGKRG